MHTQPDHYILKEITFKRLKVDYIAVYSFI